MTSLLARIGLVLAAALVVVGVALVSIPAAFVVAGMELAVLSLFAVEIS